jgi:hypothetical protein
MGFADVLIGGGEYELDHQLSSTSSSAVLVGVVRERV